MTRFRLLCGLGLLSAFLSPLGMVTSAEAQTLGTSVTVNDIVTKPTIHTDAGTAYQYWISKSDCMSDEPITFKVTLAGAVDKSLEVWAGPSSVDCSLPAARDSVVQPGVDCWRVAEPQSAANGVIEIKIPSQRIAGETTGGAHSESSCDETSSPHPGGFPLNVTFLLMSGSTVVGTPYKYSKIGTALTGPTPPTNIRAQPGGEKVLVNWDQVTGGLLMGYRLFCEPLVTVPDASNGSGGDAAQPAETTGGGTSSGGSGGTSSGGGSGGESTTGGLASSAPAAATDTSSGGDAGTGGTTTTTAVSTVSAAQAEKCEGTPQKLVPGALPPSDTKETKYSCGEATTGQGTAKTDRLNDGTQYAVGVASFDKFGNVGVLSAFACAKPKPITTFFEVYRQAGGTEGGGFCAFKYDPKNHGAWAALAGALAALVLRRKRSR